MSPVTRSSQQIVTANDLLTGDVIYAMADGCWSRYINDALLLSSETAIDKVLQQAQQQTLAVVDPYAITVALGADNRISPVHYREQIRLNGPSVAQAKSQPHISYVVMGC